MLLAIPPSSISDCYLCDIYAIYYAIYVPLSFRDSGWVVDSLDSAGIGLARLSTAGSALGRAGKGESGDVSECFAVRNGRSRRPVALTG
jgi:hypothetical protein